MRIRTTLAIGAVAALPVISACSSSATARPPHASLGCDALGESASAVAGQVLERGQFRSVTALREPIQVGRASLPAELRGAELHVLATRGTTPEYLERSLTCYAAEGRPVVANDPFHPESGRVASVDVHRDGALHVVRITGDGDAAAASILRRAQSLVGSVDVEQVASRPDDSRGRF